MSFLTAHFRHALDRHGDSWRDYFSIEVEPTTEFQQVRAPAHCGHDMERIERELRGEGGLPMSITRKRKDIEW
ncbi:hypothetical protein [Herbaspirillum huttiense]|uniref:Uncharacterized protein n=1 Tax=Herbaspirillum huttiense subsp. lycopersici TaxID=3074428 RepID=A0ABU2EFZ6_9BURK|nr:hypothetical protein [Herbaspirillum huttiense]MDR9847059.1 hypothetical protein [Herbaspirillum huttiense SE1]